MKNKICTKCHNRKDIKEFSIDTTKKDKLYPSCKDCRRNSVGAIKRPDWHGKIIRIENIECRWCQGCKKYLDCDLFYSRKNHRSDTRCKDCILIQRTTDTYRLSDRKRRIKARKLVIEKYGEKCTCCGEYRYEFLAIDHLEGGGNIHRKTMSGNKICEWLIKNNFPDGFQILCHNCNLAKGFYGKCPHETNK